MDVVTAVDVFWSVKVILREIWQENEKTNNEDYSVHLVSFNNRTGPQCCSKRHPTDDDDAIDG